MLTAVSKAPGDKHPLPEGAPFSGFGRGFCTGFGKFYGPGPVVQQNHGLISEAHVFVSEIGLYYIAMDGPGLELTW